MFGYLWLEVRRTLRDRRYLILSVVVPLALYLIFTQVFGKQQTYGLNFNAYYLVAMAAFGALGASLSVGGPRLAAERASGWTRQLRVTPLPAAAYVLAKIVTAVMLTLPGIILIELAAVLLEHVTLSLSTAAEIVILLGIGSLPFAALGIIIGLVFDVDSAQNGTTLVFILLAILGGMWLPPSEMPSVMRKIAEALPSYQFAELGWRAIGKQSPGLTHIIVLVAYLVAFGVLAAWAYRRDEAQLAV